MQSDPDAPLAQRRVLVADDNPDSADSLGLLLELAGATVHVVYDGAAALSAIDGFRPNALLLDIELPGASGYDIARAIRAREELRGTLLVALTGWSQDEDVARAKGAGFDHHLTKPVESTVLIKLLA